MTRSTLQEEGISVVIPARNEEGTIRKIVKELQVAPGVKEIIVVNNRSQDRTEARARDAGALVVNCEEVGYGRALNQGMQVAACTWIFKIDADIKNPRSEWLEKVKHKAVDNQSLLVKTYWEFTERHPGKITNLVAKPALKKLFPDLQYVICPLSGIYLFDRVLVPSCGMNNDFSFDVQLLIEAYKKGASTISQVKIEQVDHSVRPIKYYFPMAEQIINYLIDEGCRNGSNK